MRPRGVGIFFDGSTSARHVVSLELGPQAVIARGSECQILARWPYEVLQRVPAPAGMLRFARLGSAFPARLELRDPALMAAINTRTAALPARRQNLWRRRALVVIGSAGVLGAVVGGIFGLPAIADKIAPWIPLTLERELGEAVEAELRLSLDLGRSARPLECGEGPVETPGRVLVDALASRLAAVAALPIAVKVAVIRRPETNAFALPGGHIFVYQGLLAKADGPDELAGVIAHEIGHLAHRDGTKAVMRAAGLSFLFGIVLGDFVGGGAVVIAAKTLLRSAYSRQAEAAADAYSVELVGKAGGDARALSAILVRISGSIEPGTMIVMDHPQTADRVAAINAAATFHSGRALLSPTEWAVVRRICSGT
jgi:Zn-dependent protease with chaperone function